MHSDFGLIASRVGLLKQPNLSFYRMADESAEVYAGYNIFRAFVPQFSAADLEWYAL